MPKRQKIPRLAKTIDLTLEHANSCIEYDPLTGEFWRKTKVPVTANPHTGYGYVSVQGLPILAHRLAWFLTHGKWPDQLLDHKNGNRIDNRLENLRQADYSQNSCNAKRKRHNTSGVSGVFWDKQGGCWAAMIIYKRKKYWLGRFNTKEAATIARNLAAASIHGEFARMA